MNKTVFALVGALALAGCNVTTANSTAPADVPADNATVDAGTMGEQANALGATIDQNATVDNTADQAVNQAE